MKTQTLADLMVDLVRELFDAEKQLVKALPKMARAASSPRLREAFETHLEETKVHAERLAAVLELLGQPVRARKCRLMQDLLDEGKELFDIAAPKDVRDAAVAASARKVEHFEIAGYSSLCTWAGLLGESKVQKLLAQSLADERRADDLLGEIAGRPADPEAAAR
jgi:ferritin-like metal-binding protein YciE